MNKRNTIEQIIHLKSYTSRDRRGIIRELDKLGLIDEGNDLLLAHASFTVALNKAMVAVGNAAEATKVKKVTS